MESDHTPHVTIICGRYVIELPTPRSMWRVRLDGASEPLSEHNTRKEAETAVLTYQQSDARGEIMAAYHWLNIPTGNRGTRLCRWGSIALMHATLNKWNASQPGVWQYWTIVGLHKGAGEPIWSIPMREINNADE